MLLPGAAHSAISVYTRILKRGPQLVTLKGGRALRAISAYRIRPDMVTASVINRSNRYAAGLQQRKFHHALQMAVGTCLRRRSGSRLGFVGVQP